MKIISVGKPIHGQYEALIHNYEKRLRHTRALSWVFIAPSGKEKDAARRAESDAVREKITDKDFVVLLDERGRELTSERFAAQLDGWIESARPLIFVIGGAYGVDEPLRQRADMVWSLSPLVLPHELVRLVVVEQLYRAQCISSGHPYHHV